METRWRDVATQKPGRVGAAPGRGGAGAVGVLLSLAVLLATAPAAAQVSGAGGSVDGGDREQTAEQRKRAKRVKRLFEKGAAKYAEGNYAEAIVDFRRGQELYPSALFLYNIAMCHMHMGQTGRAVDYAGRALESEERALDGETAVKARAVVQGGGVVRAARSAADGSNRAGGRVERPPSPPAVGPYGWAGAAGTVVGIGGLVASGVLAADINRSWDQLQESSRGSDREAFDRQQKAILRKQRLGRGLGIGGAALTAVGAGLLIGDLVSRGGQEQVRVRPSGSGGAALLFAW